MNKQKMNEIALKNGRNMFNSIFNRGIIMKNIVIFLFSRRWKTTAQWKIYNVGICIERVFLANEPYS